MRTSKTAAAQATLPDEVMEAALVEELPGGAGWQYEPKWDGFRCLVRRDGDEVDLRGKSGKSLGRYFPDVVAGLRQHSARGFVLDGELAIPVGDLLSFEALQRRLHPARSRVERLARETPAMLIAFDMLCSERGKVMTTWPLRRRRKKLEGFFKKQRPTPVLRLSPATTRRADAEAWLARAGGGLLDGVVAKRLDDPYRPGERAMLKVKQLRTADCVVGGFRYAAGHGTGKNRLVGSLLLGLFDEEGVLHHVGFTSAIAADEKSGLTRRLEALRGGRGFTGRAPGGPSRWSTERSTHWEPVRHRLVAEVQYDHVSGDRFRHGTRFVRWRPDKAPTQCRLDQLRLEARPSRLLKAIAG